MTFEGVRMDNATGGVIALIILYFLPALIAMVRKHSNTTAIVLLDLFLGWTVIVWLVCLVWAIFGAKQQNMIVNIHNPQQPMPTYMPTMPVQQPTQPIQQPIQQPMPMTQDFTQMQQPLQQPQQPVAIMQDSTQNTQATQPTIPQQGFVLLTLQYVAGDRIYMPPNIPFDKFNNALSSYALGVNPQYVIALIDETPLGSAKIGILITFDAIYAKDAFEDPKIVRIQDIHNIICDVGFLGADVFINGEKLIGLTQPDKKGIANICGQINAFVAQNIQPQS